MRVMIHTEGGDIDIHHKIVEIVNSLYHLAEEGANGGFGDYFTHAENDYEHITSHISDTWKIKGVTIYVETLKEEEEYDSE